MKYFKLAADHQKMLGELHAQNVLSDYHLRQQKINNTIENRVFEAEKRAIENEKLQQRKMMDVLL